MEKLPISNSSNVLWRNKNNYEKKMLIDMCLQVIVQVQFLVLQCITFTGGKPRNYHEIVLTQICSQAKSGTRRGSFQAENWIKKGWCHVHFCFILQLRTNNGEIRPCSSV